MRMNKEKIYSIIALFLGISMIALVLISWLITAAIPEIAMRSLLSSEGIRWFFGHFVDNLATPVLVWMVLIGISYGALIHSGLFQALRTRRSLDYPKRFALHLVLFEMILITAIILLLTVIPHAILLSVTGNLIPSSFSNSIIPIICFSICVFSVSYGLMSGTLQSLQSIFRCLSVGITYTTSIWLLYILGAELYFSILFVFEL
jgi:p-aminobenzoyl-glutamate transporter AbgT